jgi:arginase
VNAPYAGWEWEILGAPIDCSGCSRGEERGPSALRAAGLSERLRLSDRGDVEAAIRDPTRDPETGVIGFAHLRAASGAIKAGVASILGREARPLVIGGCCSLLPGAIAGAREAVGPTALAFVDGHLDFYDGNTSDTGEAADMDLAILTGWGRPASSVQATESRSSSPPTWSSSGTGTKRRPSGSAPSTRQR